jgi:hypothetical protein
VPLQQIQLVLNLLPSEGKLQPSNWAFFTSLLYGVLINYLSTLLFVLFVSCLLFLFCLYVDRSGRAV